LDDHIEIVMEMVEPKAREKGLLLTLDFADDVPRQLIGDPTRLRQVLLNLLGNAIKFTQNGEVSLRITLDSNSSIPTSLEFTVSDSGIGIATEKLGQVFERFTQADTSTTRRFGGSGLGLTISKRLVELMGGRIWVESEVQKGSVFAFAVPFEIWLAANRSAVEETGATEDVPLAALRILLAEDSPDNCTITIAYLEDTPYTIDIAETGAMACKMFIAGDYDLVLMDRQMPVLDGLAATRTIRAWEQEHCRKPVPIIALTASALKGDREMCLAAGCTAFLTKPIRQQVLLQAIKEHTSPEYGISRKVIARFESAPMAMNAKFANRAPEFLLNCKRNVVAMVHAIDINDFQTVKFLSHGMRGAGGMFGFPIITDICASIQEATECLDGASSREHLNELSIYLDRATANTDQSIIAQPIATI
jgi:CheY-like chemotaxis protein